VARKPFHGPFEKLRALREELGRPQRPDPPPPRPEPEPSEEELWSRATAGVRPVDDPRGTAGPRPPRPSPEVFTHPDLDALRELEALVSGQAPFDLSDSDEFIEGRISGLDPAIVRRLRKGEYAVQGHIDLHGMTREEAKGAVDRFLRESRIRGKRCVLVVHGRGTHSKDQVPILKEALRSWLASNRFARHVLAFASARPADGGTGAIYVLLRRAGR
jgi:DNA-nicking Smr family endonuclease